ncbi:N-acetyltransferase [Candidatus Parcubacteria bacterium]|nr:MAG: N-acetyltransferase [Candidatus Parcubacteria bacterium]
MLLTVVTDFDCRIRYKSQILNNHLYNPDGEILAMLEYDKLTNKSVAYLLDYGAVVGFAYVEHFRHRDSFGIFVHPAYRQKGLSYLLVERVRQVLETHGLLGKPIEVDPKALKIFQKIFGESYPTGDWLGKTML